MIIPPDSEKDPNLYTPSASTTSLILPPELEIRHPDVAHRDPAFGYPLSDDLGLGFNGDSLPPYEGRRPARPSAGIDVYAGAVYHASLPSEPRPSPQPPRQPQVSTEINTFSSSSTSHLPRGSLPSHADTRNKLWESSSPPSRQGARSQRFLGVPLPHLPSFPISPGARDWWKRYRRYVQIALLFLIVGLALTIGLLVGLRTGLGNDSTSDPGGSGPPGSPGGRRTAIMSGDSLNFTYDASRDGPSQSDGNMTQCNAFSPLNASNPFSLLSVPTPHSSLTLATFNFPLTNLSSGLRGLSNDFAITARGLGASGTVEFVGSDAPSQLLGNAEGTIQVDVVARYAGSLDLNGLIMVCSMVRSDGGSGIGIYTPTQTDGKVTNVYAIDPTLLPSFHVVVRFPPSALSNSTTSSIYLPSVTFDVDRMTVRFGNMENVADFGSINVTSGRGGVTAGYVAAKTIDISTSQNSVRGTYNVSESLVVNNTDASIIADVILCDPSCSNESSRTPAPPTLNYWGLPMANLTSNHTVETRFSTSNDLISISYLHHPVRTSLTSLVSTGGGEVDVNLHPNYVGTFAINNFWGQIRLPEPRNSSRLDPQDLGRVRTVMEGIIDVPVGCLYAGAGMNQSVLQQGNTVSGAAYWAGHRLAKQTAWDAQKSTGSGGSELLVLGSWGDVTVSFDGT